jgi:HAD superfamily hydrolase (TIGR01509 family)
MTAPIECVLFDMDGVLCDYSRDTRLDELGKAMGVDREVAREVMYTSDLEWIADAGEMTVEEYMAALGKGFGQTLTDAQWLHARIAATQVRPSMVALAERLSHTVKIGVLSNNSLMMERHLRTVAPGLFPLFEGRAWVSAQCGAIKPKAACYLNCLAFIGVRPEHTLFLDDAQENVDGAIAAGLQGHLFSSQAEFERLLVEYDLP